MQTSAKFISIKFFLILITRNVEERYANIEYKFMQVLFNKYTKRKKRIKEWTILRNVFLLQLKVWLILNPQKEVEY